MPTHCYVPGCKSGYGKDDVGKRHFFTPPKEEKMFLKWSNAIARQDWPFSKKSFVCDLHFGDELLQKCDTFFIEGKKVELSRRKWILDPTAVPHIFPSPANARMKRPKGFQIHRRCCVPGCNFDNYNTVGLHGYVSTFIFPKDEERKQRWICAIPGTNWLPKQDSSVCAKHFNKEDIIVEENRKLPDGTVRKFVLRKPKLKKDAVPCNFPQCLDSWIPDVTELKNNIVMHSDEHYMDIKTKTKEKHQQQEEILNEIKLEQEEASVSYDALQNEQVSFSSYFLNCSKDSVNMHNSENEVKTRIEIKEEPCSSV